MATIVHRRTIRPAPPTTAGEAWLPPPGPGARLGVLTIVGWVSLVGVVAWLVISWRFLLDLGEPRQWDWGALVDSLWPAVPVAATIGLPAALEWGVPRARSRVPWLWRGTVLLAIEAAAREGLRAVQSAYVETMDVFATGFNDPVWSALTLLGVGLTLLLVAGWWALSDGLSDAGASLSRTVLLEAVAIGLITPIMSMWALLVAIQDPSAVWPIYGPIGVVVVVAASLLSGAAFVLATVAAARLVAGAAMRLRPRPAWLLGAAAGVVQLGGRILSAVLLAVTVTPGVDTSILTAALVAGPLMLAAAFAAGLGGDVADPATGLRPGYRLHRAVAPA